MSEESDQPNFDFNRLLIDKVLGSSVRACNQVSVRDNLIAYTASGGVVVAEICLLDQLNQFKHQRFFCANSNVGNTNSLGADAYLNMAFGAPNDQNEVQRDSYGYLIGEPINVARNCLDMEPIHLNEDSSPSKLKHRFRNINCITISPDKKLLAIGEIGYNPRILIFSLAPDLSDNPIALIYEHSFGINSLEFSPDLKHLCSLGLVNDGFINIWKIHPNSITIASSNKCSSVINQVIWHKSLIVTLGLRLIKVWKFEEDQKALKGKNVVLASHINSNFIKADFVNDEELLLITDVNQLLLLKFNYDVLKLIGLESPPFEFENLLVDSHEEKIWFGSNQTIESLPISYLRPSTTAPTMSPRRSKNMFSSPVPVPSPILKLANLNNKYLFLLNNSEQFILYDKAAKENETLQKPLISNLQVLKNAYSGEILICSKDGVINQLIGDDHTTRLVANIELPSSELISNCMTTVDKSGDLLIVGDKFGTLTIMNSHDSGVIFQTKAHSSTINDLIYYKQNDVEFITSISRDRMIQFFYKTAGSDWDILQTVSLHNGNLIKVQYINDRVYVCSSDRNISVLKIEIDGSKIQIFQEKLLAIKATPITFGLFEKDLAISTNDKTLLVYNIDSYELKRSLKLMDEVINESLLVENFTVKAGNIIAACSDKSLRVFNYVSGKPVFVAWGHLESILGLIIKENHLISISVDGCLIQWKLADKPLTSTKSTPTSLHAEETFPVYTNVTRKIVPTVPLSRAPILKAAQSPDPEPLVPTSVSPRLTNATLKRMEARRMNSSPTSGSPKLQPSTKLNRSPTKPRNSLTRSPSVPPLPRSPTKSTPAIPPLPSSPTRPIVVPGMGNVKLQKPIPKVGSITKKPVNMVETILDHLDKVDTLLRNDLEKLTEQDSKLLKEKLSRIQNLIERDDDENIESGIRSISLEPLQPNENHVVESQILERYSEKLLKMLETKLDERSRFLPYMMNVRPSASGRLDENNETVD